MPPAASLPHRLMALLNALPLAPQAVNARETPPTAMGAGLGLALSLALSLAMLMALVGALGHAVMSPSLPWLMALLVASAVRAARLDGREVFAGRLRTLLRPMPATSSTQPELLVPIMRHKARVAVAGRFIAESVPLRSRTGHRLFPTVGGQASPVGILTPPDLVKALSHHDA